MHGFLKGYVVIGTVLYIGICIVMLAFGGLYFFAELVMIGIGYMLHKKRAHLKATGFWTNWICGTTVGLIAGAFLGPGVIVAAPLVRFGFVYWF